MNIISEVTDKSLMAKFPEKMEKIDAYYLKKNKGGKMAKRLLN
jgi:hypothetical protein